MTTLPAREWNKLLAFLRTYTFPVSGKNCRISRTVNGTSVRPKERLLPWRHPFHVTPFWDENQSHWSASIKAGFLNGDAPIYSENEKPLTDADTSMRLAPMAVVEGVPQFFKLMGVRESLASARVGGSFGIQIVDNSWENEFLPEELFLARSDIILRKPRIGMRGIVEILPSASGNTAVFMPEFMSENLDRLGDRGRIYATGIYAPPAVPTLMQKLTGDYTDPQEDTLHLASVWFVSPSSESKEIDGSWQPFVEHKIFWNLLHAAPMPEAPKTINPLTLATGLVGGLADAAFASILASNNDASMNVLAALQTISPSGQFFNT